MTLNQLKKLKILLFRIKRILRHETVENKEMISTYYKIVNKKASPEEIKKANEQFRQLLKTLGVSVIFLMPLGSISLPVFIKLSKIFSIELLPKSFKDDHPTNQEEKE